MAGVAVLVAIASWAHAASCPNQITTCGCVISSAGDYKVTSPLTHSPPGLFCLEVDAARVRLDLGGNSIADSPPPPGPPVVLDTGIHLTKRATKAIVVGGGATISGFLAAGIAIESSGAIVSDLKADTNGDGIDLTGAHDIQLVKIEANNNGGIGVSLVRSSDNQISNLSASSNAGVGIDISGISDTNRISDFQTNSNGDAGVVIARLTCNRLGQGPGCHQRGGRGNYLAGGDASGNQFGIAIDDRTSATTIVGNTATMNAQADLKDGSANCDHNLWFGNTFTVASPSSCIH